MLRIGGRRRGVRAGLLAMVAFAMIAAVGPAARADTSSGSVSAATMFSTGGIAVAGMSIAPDGRVFFAGQSSNKIFVWSPSTHQVTTFATIAHASDVYGVALHPQFATNHYVYAYARVAVGTTQDEQLVRYTDKSNVGQGFKLLRDVGPIGTGAHYGGKILFGPKGGNLFLVIGDGGNPANSQDLSIDHGKILRLTAQGLPASGNPGYADAAVYASGIRNSIGMANDPLTGRMWETENGPECNDEINRIVAGGNYGWGPNETCDGTAHGTNQDGANPIQPAENISTVMAPVGATFCHDCGIPEAANDLVYGRYLTNDLRTVTLNAARTTVVSDNRLYQDDSSILAVESSPVDGSIWFADGSDNVKRLTESSSQNLIQNPSFETDLTGWTAHTGTLSRVDCSADPAPDGGNFCAHVEWASTTNYSLTDTDRSVGLLPTVPTAPAGATYSASAYVRGTAGRHIHILLREQAPKGAFVRDTTGTKVVTTGDWQLLTATATVLNSGDNLGIRIQQDEAGPGDAFDADVLTLERTS